MKRAPRRTAASAMLAAACVLGSHESVGVAATAQPTAQPSAQPKGPPPASSASGPPARKPESPKPGSPADDLARLAAQLRREEAPIRVVRIALGGPGQRVESRAAVQREWLATTAWSVVEGATPRAAAMMEYRTGPRASMALHVEDGGLVELRGLTRARVLRVSVDEASSSARRVVVELARGKVDVRPDPGRSVNVQTPDGIVVVREPVRVSYDAVRGVRVQALAPAPSAPGAGNPEPPKGR